MTNKENPRILIAGASGYVGGRLVHRLMKRPVTLRCMARGVEGMHERWGKQVEVVQADVLEPDTLEDAVRDVDMAYYLIHSMGEGGDFEERERRAAENFGRAAAQAGVKRILFLGGLADDRIEQSPHMRSRHATGRALRESRLPTLEFRASVVIGAGSLSFEMIRALVERLPIMITPKWVRVDAQPIAISDLMDYLEAGLDLTDDQMGIYEIGGAEVTTYKELMRTYAEVRGLKRIFVPVPVLSPRISSLWLGLVTPLFARVGRKLIESVTHPSVVRNPAAREVFEVKPRGVREAVESAIEEEEHGMATTRWSDSLVSGNTHRTWAGVRFGTRLVDSRTRTVTADPEQVFAAVERIGGETGWYYGNWLWTLRGAIDELVGGVGMRRGRRHVHKLRPGDVLDCWRVESLESPRFLRLRAEMKLPGRAWLEFEVTPAGDTCTLRQTAVFDPKGLSGNLYWFGIFPLHQFVFKGMLRGISREAERPGREKVGHIPESSA